MLSKIIGYKFSKLGRAAGTIWLCFGDDKEIDIHKLNSCRKHTVSEIAIHVECTLRIKYNGSILIGNIDMFQPLSEYENDDFNWDVQGANQFDAKAKIINEYFKNCYVSVTNYKICDGDLYIYLSDGKVIEILIDTSLESECWRYFEPGNNKPHLVATGTGIEYW